MAFLSLSSWVNPYSPQTVCGSDEARAGRGSRAFVEARLRDAAARVRVPVIASGLRTHLDSSRWHAKLASAPKRLRGVFGSSRIVLVLAVCPPLFGMKRVFLSALRKLRMRSFSPVSRDVAVFDASSSFWGGESVPFERVWCSRRDPWASRFWKSSADRAHGRRDEAALPEERTCSLKQLLFKTRKQEKKQWTH